MLKVDVLGRLSPMATTATYLTTKEVCDLLRISAMTLLRWRKARKISYIRLGGRTLYSRTAIEKFIAARTMHSA
jgi:excisionase family DNA binding protein